MSSHWFVVASQKNTKVFTDVPEQREIKKIKSFDNPLGQFRNRDMVKKQAGMGTRSLGRIGTVRYSQTKRHDPYEDGANQFAKSIAKSLAADLQQKRFESLTIVAEPHFMGKLKAAMGADLKKYVTNWMNKNLQKTPQAQLSRILIPMNKKRVTGIPGFRGF